MYIIGLNIFHNDSSATLIKDGKILFASTEERFNRVKHSSQFPIRTLEYIFKKFNIGKKDIDYFSINSKSNHYLKKNIILNQKSSKVKFFYRVL